MTIKRDKLDIVKDFMGESIYNKIISTYPASTRAAITGQYHRMKDEFPKFYNRLESCNYNKDTRTTEQYARDLAVSWVIEDFAKAFVRKFAGVDMRLAGGDSTREYQARGRVSAAADFVILNKDGTKTSVEFITDYHGYYSKKGFFQLRNNKLPKLLKEAEGRDVMIFSMNLKDKTFFLQDVRGLRYTADISWGKPTNKVFMDFDEIKFTQKNIKEAFTKEVV